MGSQMRLFVQLRLASTILKVTAPFARRHRMFG